MTGLPEKGEETEGRGELKNSTPFPTVATLTVVWLKPFFLLGVLVPTPEIDSTRGNKTVVDPPKY